MFKNILIAVDGSEHAYKAAELAGNMARLTGADVYLVTVYDPIPAYLGQPNLQEAITERMSKATEALQIAQQRIGAISGELKTETLEGPVAEAILAVADARRIDLIVMGTRGLGRLAGLLLGSQSQKVISHAVCPVMLVH